MSRAKTWTLDVRAAVILVIAVAWPAPAWAANRGAAAAAAAKQRAIATLQQQLAEARQVLSVAQAELAQAQGKIDESKSRVEAAKSALESARSEERSSHQTLDQIEADLIDKAGPDSEIGKARTEFLAAEEEHATTKKNVLNSPEYKEQAAALDPGDRSKKLPILQKEAFKNDNDYQHALKRLKAAKVRWGQLRTAMVQKSDEWMAASKAVRDAQHEENKADGDAKSGAMARMPAAARFRDAREVAEAAMETIAMCEQNLRALGVNPTPPAKTSAKK